ncbi:hypothetical protein [Sphingomonas oligophenolica]|uniref:hypothetical protein n=1 Tax=Sphingomonas oligophenolica TaxID=301154 RepID=UPI0011298F9E|nr:hypothetical protein [Sphingomonas oligophenolica]
MSVILLELNEVNFDFIQAYVAKGELPTFARLIARHGIQETESEDHYEELEPWIQWVSAHTGMTLAEHGVFRLGDIVDRPDINQIWEVLERQGVGVAAMSPMNAVNRCSRTDFFVPDPWTPTPATAPAAVLRLYGALVKAVNDNAEGELDGKSLFNLLAGVVIYARPINYFRYVALAVQAARGSKWVKAMFLDLLLVDVFMRVIKSSKPGFSSLFLNAAAHIQHHYMFNAEVYDGPNSNPDWYVDSETDPVFAVYALYDRIVRQIERAFPASRIMLATGLHQEPYSAPTYYWRLRDHAAFLSATGVPFERVEPRMSRDFLIYSRNAEQSIVAEEALARITTQKGEALFDVDNRGDTMFVTLVWPHDIGEEMVIYTDGTALGPLRPYVNFVAIKNGGHNGIGYFIDTGATSPAAGRFRLTEMPLKIAAACNAEWHPST